MAHKPLVFPVGEGRTCAVTSTLNRDSGTVLAQLDPVNMAGAGPNQQSTQRALAAAPMALWFRMYPVYLLVEFTCKGPLWRLIM